MFMFLHRLGRNMLCGTSLRPSISKTGKGKVTAVFQLSHEDIESVRRVGIRCKVTPTFVAEIQDENECVAEVEKVIYIEKESKRA